MEEYKRLATNFGLQVKTYKTNPVVEDWSFLMVQDKFWERILDADLDIPALKQYFKKKSDEERVVYFKFGVACFRSFVQKNFTGPPLSQYTETWLEDRFKVEDFASRLSIHNEEINVNTKYPALLLAAEIVFDNCFIHDLVNKWWCCRAVMLHQDIMDELSTVILSNAERLGARLEAIPLTGHLKAEVHLELANMYLKFLHISKAQELIASSREALGLDYELKGMLAKRTQYQARDIAQLILDVQLKDADEISRPELEKIKIPTSFSLQDDILLERVLYRYSSGVTKLPNTEQKLLLTHVQYKLITIPDTELFTEELFPYLRLIIDQQNTYCVRVMALLLRCKLESKDKRAADRCLKQCEDIVSYFNQDDPSAVHRIGDVFGTSLVPIWQVKAQHADTLLNIGLVKNALEVYMEVKLWEETIVCFTIMEMREKSAEIIRKHLQQKPSVKMMCLLGDATDDETCYERAWEMSRRRSHVVQRHWGQFFFIRKKYGQCIEHFSKSVSINPLQPNIWFRYGLAALKIGNWQLASLAFRRYITIEPESFEAWNNLAEAYLRQGNKLEAHRSVLEAIKCDYENWRVWENLLIIACEIQNYSDAIRAYHRLLDIKKTYMDLHILGSIVYAVCHGANDSGSSTGSLSLQAQELIGRIIALHPTDSCMWEFYANLAPILMVKIQRFQRAYRGYAQGAWDKDPDLCYRVLSVCLKLGDMVLDDEIDPSNNILGSVKFNLASALTAARKHNWEDNRQQIEDVTRKLEAIIEKMKKGNTL